jgi:hypothetical protein
MDGPRLLPILGLLLAACATAPAKVDTGNASAADEVQSPPVQQRVLLIDLHDDRYRPRLPPGLPPRPRTVITTMCVAPTGLVRSVKLEMGEEPAVNEEVIAKVKTWRYRPHVVGTQPLPSCFSIRVAMNRDGVTVTDGYVAHAEPGAGMLPPSVAQQHLIIDPQAEPYRPLMPPGLEGHHTAMTKVCVSSEGAVTLVEFMNPVDSRLKSEIAAKIGTWRYRPYTVDGRAIPFCFVMRLDLTR